MSRENVELVREMYEAYLAGDAKRSLAFFHPDVEVDFSVRVDIGVTRGRDAVAQVVSSWIATWDEYTEELREIRDLGDQVCVVAMQRGRGKGSGVELSTEFASLYEIRDGMVTRITMYSDLASALEAARGSQPG
jgi:ketosteroid isomerase-like protein